MASKALLFRERNESCRFAKDDGLDLVCGNNELKKKMKCDPLASVSDTHQCVFRFSEKTRGG